MSQDFRRRRGLVRVSGTRTDEAGAEPGFPVQGQMKEVKSAFGTGIDEEEAKQGFQVQEQMKEELRQAFRYRNR